MHLCQQIGSLRKMTFEQQSLAFDQSRFVFPAVVLGPGSYPFVDDRWNSYLLLDCGYLTISDSEELPGTQVRIPVPIN